MKFMRGDFKSFFFFISILIEYTVINNFNINIYINMKAINYKILNTLFLCEFKIFCNILVFYVY